MFQALHMRPQGPLGPYSQLQSRLLKKYNESVNRIWVTFCGALFQKTSKRNGLFLCATCQPARSAPSCLTYVYVYKKSTIFLLFMEKEDCVSYVSTLATNLDRDVFGSEGLSLVANSSSTEKPSLIRSNLTWVFSNEEDGGIATLPTCLLLTQLKALSVFLQEVVWRDGKSCFKFVIHLLSPTDKQESSWHSLQPLAD